MGVLEKQGLTPLYIRLASSFLAQGVGVYKCDVFGYDKVKVVIDKPWSNYAYPGNPTAYFMTTRVEFYSREELRKWVEFKSSMVGGGSREQGLHVVDTEEE